MKFAIARLVGEHVYSRRTKRGLTQSEVATMIGISRQALSSIERGTQLPYWPTLYAVAGALRCDVFDLLPTYRQVKALSAKQ